VTVTVPKFRVWRIRPDDLEEHLNIDVPGYLFFAIVPLLSELAVVWCRELAVFDTAKEKGDPMLLHVLAVHLMNEIETAGGSVSHLTCKRALQKIFTRVKNSARSCRKV